MRVYIDSDFKCHLTNPDETFVEITTSFFDDKCQTFIEGYRFIPEGYTWVRDDGEEFQGIMICPWKNYNELIEAQHIYELEQFNALKQENVDLVSSIAELTELIYKNDLTVME